MTLPLPGATPEPDGVAGETYGAALVAADGATRDAVVGVLRTWRQSAVPFLHPSAGQPAGTTTTST